MYRNSPHVYSDMNSLGSSLQGARLSHSIRSLAHLAESCSSSATPSVTYIASAQVRIPASSRPPLACLHERNFVFDRVIIAHLTIGSHGLGRLLQYVHGLSQKGSRREHSRAFSPGQPLPLQQVQPQLHGSFQLSAAMHCNQLCVWNPSILLSFYAMKHNGKRHIHTHPDVASLIIISV